MSVRTASSPRCVTWRQNFINVDREVSFLNAVLKLTPPVNSTKVFVRTIYMGICFFRILPSIFTMAKTFFFLKPYSCFLGLRQRDVTTFGKVIWKWNFLSYWSLVCVISTAFLLIHSLVESFVWVWNLFRNFMERKDEPKGEQFDAGCVR